MQTNSQRLANTLKKWGVFILIFSIIAFSGGIVIGLSALNNEVIIAICLMLGGVIVLFCGLFTQIFLNGLADIILNIEKTAVSTEKIANGINPLPINGAENTLT